MGQGREYKARNQMMVYLTETLARILDDEKQETGEAKASIIRYALNEYMMRKIAEKIKRREAIKPYMVDVYANLKIDKTENPLNKNK